MSARRPRLNYVKISSLTDGDVEAMTRVRYASLPSLVGRTFEEDLARFKTVLADFQYAGLVLQDGIIKGFAVFALYLRKFRNRKFLWVHMEDVVVLPELRGMSLTQIMASRIILAARLSNPFLPMYGLSPVFPPTYLESRSLFRVYVWGDPTNPPWHAALLDAAAREIAGDRPFDRAGHYVQLRVTTGSARPRQFRDARRAAWFADYERAAPGWAEGRVPIVLFEVSLRRLLLSALLNAARSLQRKIGGLRR